MSGSLAAIITIPIVAFIALFGWLGAVMWASTHPRYRTSGNPPRTEVAGGAFRAVDGGRQLMPIPEHRPFGVPGPRAAEAATARPASGAAAVPVPGQRTGPADTSQPVAGASSPAQSASASGPFAAAAGHGLERGASALTRSDLELAKPGHDTGSDLICLTGWQAPAVPAACAAGTNQRSQRDVPAPCAAGTSAHDDSAQLALIQVLLNEPVLDIALVESLGDPLLLTMMISVGD